MPFSTLPIPEKLPYHIHLQENTVPTATHSPILIPVHWKKDVKCFLDKDVELGILEKVLAGELVEWCTRMVHKNGGSKEERWQPQNNC